ncbi:hypothetical protein EG329_007261 [Mollisiaceae sp. DMI_Dod_QoI]|nr:hypothetical protein EG329_007261 [Helotiales sp. DMI_Dod_QoI]
MSSQTPPAPQINKPTSATPPPPDKPETGYFSPHPLGAGRNATPGGTAISPLSVPVTPPFSLLRTPPAEPQSRQDGNYFSPQTQHRPSRLTQTPTPSDNVSNSSCLCPSGGSFHSSDIGRSTCSGSSSEYLSPPLFQGDNDNPPYKPRRGSADSLTMIKRLGRAKTMPNKKDAPKKSKKHHRKRRKCSHRKIKMHEHENRSYWWLPGCQVVPTAPRGLKDLCGEHGGQNTQFKFRNTDLDRPLSTESGSNAIPVAVARRWSSVEVGAHQIISELTSPLRPAASTVLASPQSEVSPPMGPPGRRFRSSTFTRGTMDNDIVHTVRERLTLRRIASASLKTPASITLRRPSNVSSGSRATQTPGATIESNEPSGGATPLARLQGFLHQKRPSAAYLITSSDIDTITELIEENLRRNYKKGSNNKSTNASSTSSLSPTVTTKGVVVPQNFPDLALTVAEAQTRSAPLYNPVDYLQVNKVKVGHKGEGNLSRVLSQRSEHEVLWQGGGSPQSIDSSTTEDDETKRSSYFDRSHGSSTPRDTFHRHDLKVQEDLPISGDRSHAFDPENANASINEWSLRCPQNDIAVVITSSDSDSNDNDGATRGNPFAQTVQSHSLEESVQAASTTKGRSKHKVQRSPRRGLSEGNLQKPRSRGLTLEDVFSFPPLPPRKATEEWFSPLPEMISNTTLSTSRSLYDIGLDANFGPLCSKTITPKASQGYFPRPAELSSPQVSPSESIEFKPGFSMRKKGVINNQQTKVGLSQSESLGFKPDLEVRKKSVIKDHPTAVSRVAELGTMGSAIGSYGHERRRSSAVPGPRIQRVRTIDNIHKGEHDSPPSKWRPPSAFPSRKPSSPTEVERAKESRPPSPNPMRRWGTGGFLDRVSLIRDRSPPQPKVDPVGIYAQLTGARRATTLRDPCLLEDGPCQPHDCDDCSKDLRSPSVDWIG